MDSLRALLVEEDLSLSGALRALLTTRGFDVETAASLTRGRALIDEGGLHLLVLSLELRGGSGLELVSRARARGLRDVIVISAHGDLATVSSAFQSGAVDFLPKPLDLRRLDGWLVKAAQRHAAAQCNERGDSPLVGLSAPFLASLDALRERATCAEPVVLHGLSGVGKSRLARELHRLSPTAHGRLVFIQAEGTTPAEFVQQLEAAGRLLPSDRCRPSLVVEEFTLLPLTAQSSLIGIGDPDRAAWDQHVHADYTRLILTTSSDPAAELKRGGIRSDLWYRVEAGCIHVPELSAREDDVVHLAEHYLQRERAGAQLSPVTRGALLQAAWPGNVRQLIDAVRRAAARSGGSVTPEQLGLGTTRGGEAVNELVEVPVGTTLDAARRMLVLATLRATGGDKVRTADVLGISLKTLYNRLREYRHLEQLEPLFGPGATSGGTAQVGGTF